MSAPKVKKHPSKMTKFKNVHRLRIRFLRSHDAWVETRAGQASNGGVRRRSTIEHGERH